LWELGWRLSELISLDAETRQQLLGVEDPLERIGTIVLLVAGMANEY